MQALRHHWGGAIAALLLLGAMTALVALDQRHGTLRADITPRTIGWYVVAFVGFGLAAWWNEHRTIPPWVLWSVPIAARLILLATEPTLSDDVYRYLWDGHVLSEGISPYRYSINAAELDSIDIPIRALTNNPDLASPYLPTAQGVFTVAAFTLPSTALVMQTLMVGFDLITAGLLSRLLVRAGLPRRRVLLYLWNPLVIVEIAHGAHLDALTVMLTIAALVTGLEATSWTGPRRRVWSGVLLALAALTRPVPLLTGPVLWSRWGWSGRLAFGATLIGLLLPFGLGSAGWGLGAEATGTGLFGSARIYQRDFRFNGALNDLLEPGSVVTTSLVGVIMAVVVLGVWRRAAVRDGSTATPADVVRTNMRLTAIPIMAYVLLTPVLHPWYLVLLMALLPVITPTTDEGVDRWLLTAPWYYLAGAVSFSYLTYLDPEQFAERSWVRWLEWLPTVGLLILVTARVRYRRPT